MKLLGVILFFYYFDALSQIIQYSPAEIIEKNIDADYYSTEYIFIKNNSSQTLTINFNLVSQSLPGEWSATGCTNLICYIELPDEGTLGSLVPESQGYFSVNLAANGVTGNGEIVYALHISELPDFSDTISFKYAVENQLDSIQKPWAQINYSNEIIHVFLDDASLDSEIYLLNSKGQIVMYSALEEITSFSVVNFPAGVYFAVIRRADGKELKQKMVII